MLPDIRRGPIRLYEPGSSRLIAVGHADGDGQGLAIDKGAGPLLAYYFGQGKREVLVRAGFNEGLSAHLSTRWAKGHREWTLDW